MTGPLQELLAPLLDALADRVVARLTTGQRADLQDQVASPLGRRRHIAAVRGRVARGDAGAAIVGRRHLLTRDALAAELETLSQRKPRKTPKPGRVDELDTLRDRYGIERAKGQA